MRTFREIDEAEPEKNGTIKDGTVLRVPLMFMDSMRRTVAATATLDRAHDFAAAFRRDHDRRKALDAALHSSDASVRDATRAGLAAAPVGDALSEAERHASIFRAVAATRGAMKRNSR